MKGRSFFFITYSYNDMKPTFWRKLKTVLVVLFVLFVLGAVGCFFVIEEGWKRLFLASCSAILAVNILLAYIFVRVNDRRRPS